MTKQWSNWDWKQYSYNTWWCEASCNSASLTLSHTVWVMCNTLCSCAPAPCLCWSDIETGCLSLDHHQLHLSQLATTASAFLMSTSIKRIRNIAHASVSKTARVCPHMLTCECGAENKEGKENVSDALFSQLMLRLYSVTDTHWKYTLDTCEELSLPMLRGWLMTPIVKHWDKTPPVMM